MWFSFIKFYAINKVNKCCSESNTRQFYGGFPLSNFKQILKNLNYYRCFQKLVFWQKYFSLKTYLFARWFAKSGFLKRFLKKLNEPFPEHDSPKENVRNIIGVGIFITLFLYFFQVGGMHEYRGPIFYICLNFGLITIAIFNGRSK